MGKGNSNYSGLAFITDNHSESGVNKVSIKEYIHVKYCIQWRKVVWWQSTSKTPKHLTTSIYYTKQSQNNYILQTIYNGLLHIDQNINNSVTSIKLLKTSIMTVGTKIAWSTSKVFGFFKDNPVKCNPFNGKNLSTRKFSNFSLT